MKVFFFTSSRVADNCSAITICTTSFEKAVALAAKSFIKWGYKGTPKRLAV